MTSPMLEPSVVGVTGRGGTGVGIGVGTGVNDDGRLAITVIDSGDVMYGNSWPIAEASSVIVW